VGRGSAGREGASGWAQPHEWISRKLTNKRPRKSRTWGALEGPECPSTEASARCLFASMKTIVPLGRASNGRQSLFLQTRRSQRRSVGCYELQPIWFTRPSWLVSLSLRRATGPVVHNSRRIARSLSFRVAISVCCGLPVCRKARPAASSASFSQRLFAFGLHQCLGPAD
jgi:hypothetical protein